MLLISTVRISQSDSTHQCTCTGAQPVTFTAVLLFLKFSLLKSSQPHVYIIEETHALKLAACFYQTEPLYTFLLPPIPLPSG